MISAPATLLFDTARLSIFANVGAKPSRCQREHLAGSEVRSPHKAEVLEWAIGGEVVGRKVTALGTTECWLRGDLAEATRAALAAEAADYARVAAEVGAFIKSTDEQGARRNGVTVEQYRAKRHAAGARFDRYRAANRAGGGL
jgi:hypothetical protein